MTTTSLARQAGPRGRSNASPKGAGPCSSLRGRLQALSLAILAALTCMAALTGCAGQGAPIMTPAAPAVDPEQAMYRQGMELFLAGEYALADQRFEPLAWMAADPTLRRRALYALANSRILLAKTPAQFEEAVDLWLAWSSIDQPSPDYPDARLMAPLVEMLRPPQPEDCDASTDAQKTPGQQAAKAKDEPRPKPVDKTDPECRKNVKSLERKVRLLQEQLNALETISQEIREKRREMSSPR